jgi:drug/metabolite transporter (DMT)-like permease
MHKSVFIMFAFLAVSAVAIADVFLKKAAVAGTMTEAMKSPHFWIALGLYLFQILFFTYMFVMGMKLSFIGVLQTVLYAVIVLTSGYLLFHEQMSLVQGIGMTLGLAGAVLMNL